MILEEKNEEKTDKVIDSVTESCDMESHFNILTIIDHQGAMDIAPVALKRARAGPRKRAGMVMPVKTAPREGDGDCTSPGVEQNVPLVVSLCFRAL